MAKTKKAPARTGKKQQDPGFPVLHHRCTVNTEHWKYQVILTCKDLLAPVVLVPGSAAKFTALMALLTSGHTVYYWPAGGKVGIHTAQPSPKRSARTR